MGEGGILEKKKKYKDENETENFLGGKTGNDLYYKEKALLTLVLFIYIFLIIINIMVLWVLHVHICCT
jgi:hypothetical protein